LLLLLFQQFLTFPESLPLSAVVQASLKRAAVLTYETPLQWLLALLFLPSPVCSTLQELLNAFFATDTNIESD
jgi:hypothetical protein